MDACTSRTADIPTEKVAAGTPRTMDTVSKDVTLGDKALEAAFPQSGIFQMWDGWVKMNKSLMSQLEDGTLYHHDGSIGPLTAGSQGERLALETRWGHPDADYDWMYLHGGPLGVYVAGGQQPRGTSCLEFRLEGSPAAYCKLEVNDFSRLKESKVDHLRWCDDSCVDASDGRQWMNTNNAVRKMKNVAILTHDSDAVAGPAAQSDIYNTDTVQTLVCSGSYPDPHDEFQSRPRGSWPPLSLIKYILQMPMLLVLVGHKGSPESEFKRQARMSWSHLELKLIQGLPDSVRQGYIACKYVMKRFLEAHRGQNAVAEGRSRVCSYHIKVVFLRYLEEKPPSHITSPFGLFLDLLNELDKYLKVGKLPHYFLAQCNLLETVADHDLVIARRVISVILSDPLNAILTSPTDPQQIYGEVSSDDLVVAFQEFSSHRTHEQYWNLSVLLARVDERRRQRFQEQQEEDDTYRISGRAELNGLVDMLKAIKPNVI